jgi:hypothetical protein
MVLPSVHCRDLLDRLTAKLRDGREFFIVHPDGTWLTGAAIAAAGASELKAVFVPRLGHRSEDLNANVDMSSEIVPIFGESLPAIRLPAASCQEPGYRQLLQWQLAESAVPYPVGE